jgi:lysophospholipase L1-like esterase
MAIFRSTPPTNRTVPVAAPPGRTSGGAPVVVHGTDVDAVPRRPLAAGHGRGWAWTLASSVLLVVVADTARRIRYLRRAGRRVAPLDHDIDLPGRFPPRTLVVIGDSAAAGHGLPSADLALARLTGRLLVDRDGRATAVRCAAVDGATTATVQAEQVGVVAGAEVVLVGVGVNDALDPRRPIEEAAEVLDDLLTAVRRTARPGVRIVLLSCPDLGRAPGLPPLVRPLVGWRCRRLARAQAEVARRHRVDLIAVPADVLGPELFGPDGVHPGVRGHDRLAIRVAAMLEAEASDS